MSQPEMGQTINAADEELSVLRWEDDGGAINFSAEEPVFRLNQTEQSQPNNGVYGFLASHQTPES